LRGRDSSRTAARDHPTPDEYGGIEYGGLPVAVWMTVIAL
jgi:hypothetical protein